MSEVCWNCGSGDEVEKCVECGKNFCRQCRNEDKVCILCENAEGGGIRTERKCSNCGADKNADDEIMLKRCRVCDALFCTECMCGDICPDCEGDIDDGQR